ncbi:MAG TPA: vitamin K epoxide reductase family protein, partial [Chloroflexaceae bacterium]|nr:vitamin K epoxide reductase family protein [Chloroflexaceae bacterium]
EQARRAGLALLLLTGAGTLFSIYLTFLEPFVIGASCMWCLSSAALMTALLWLAAPPPQAPLRRGRPRHSPAH